MMDDVLLAGVRQLAAKPADRAIVGTQQSAQAYGRCARTIRRSTRSSTAYSCR
jgi:hypothetical protein